tara:strand:+ start:229 stop:900 length:672 start_codon:yes stop_codon:yes gene_type:complete
MIGGKNIPTDEKLYSSIKKKVKAKFQKTSRWPSAYGSGFLVKEYKKAFKEKYGNKSPYKIEKNTNKKSKKSKKINKSTKKSRKSVKKSNKNNLTRWFNEKWVNVCKKKSGKYVPCGRKKSSMKKYPYCRPLHRINSGTPMTVGEIKKKYGSKKLKEMCKRKNSKRDKKSMTYVKKTIKKSKNKKSKKKSKKWSKKYKKSINCKKPKGFSQKQYCKYGRKKSRK